MNNRYIGGGEYSSVYESCLNFNCKTKAAKKVGENMIVEYNITKLLHDLVPGGVIKPYDKHSEKTMYLELLKLNNTNKNKIYSLKKVKKVLKHVVRTLMKIQKIYPTFRHNDLHWENIFVSKDLKQIFIGDFGFSNIQKKGCKNKLVQSGLYKRDYGIEPKENTSYDIALLMNDIHLRGTPEIKNFIEKIIPKDYIGEETDKIKKQRLRYNKKHTNFPTLKKIFDKL